MTKTERLYPRPLRSRTGSTADLQRTPSSVNHKVGQSIGVRASHREAGAIGEGADELSRTADLISLRVINRTLQRFARVCESPMSKGFPFP